jgi:hypothetical protein
MTRHEWARRARQAQTLIDLGFTASEAEQLRRISRTLHRWHERECGDGSGCLVRGYLNPADGTFEYDEDGAPFLELSGVSGRGRYRRVPDRALGARRRLQQILTARNRRSADALRPYIQSDPRGAALYLLRPGDVPEGADPAAYYSRGICVY